MCCFEITEIFLYIVFEMAKQLILHGEMKCVQTSFLQCRANCWLIFPILFAFFPYFCSIRYVIKCQCKIFFFCFMVEFWKVNNSTYNLLWGKTPKLDSEELFCKHIFFFLCDLKDCEYSYIRRKNISISDIFCKANMSEIHDMKCNRCFLCYLSTFHPRKKGIKAISKIKWKINWLIQIITSAGAGQSSSHTAQQRSLS